MMITSDIKGLPPLLPITGIQGKPKGKTGIEPTQSKDDSSSKEIRGSETQQHKDKDEDAILDTEEEESRDSKKGDSDQKRAPLDQQEDNLKETEEIEEEIEEEVSDELDNSTVAEPPVPSTDGRQPDHLPTNGGTTSTKPLIVEEGHNTIPIQTTTPSKPPKEFEVNVVMYCICIQDVFLFHPIGLE